MKKPGPHAILPEISQEEQSRLSFFVSLSGATRRGLAAGNELIYERTPSRHSSKSMDGNPPRPKKCGK